MFVAGGAGVVCCEGCWGEEAGIEEGGEEGSCDHLER